MVMGRPPEWDVEFLKQEFLDWGRLPNSLNINAFCASLRPEIDPDYLKYLIRKDEDFSRVFRIVRAHLAARREEAVSEKVLDTTAYNRNIHHYDKFLYDDWKEEKAFEYELKEKENVPLNNENLDKFFESLPHLHTIKKLQAEIDELKRQADLKHIGSEKTAKYMGGSSKKRKNVLKHPETN